MKTLTFRLALVMIFSLPWENVVELPGIGRISKLLGILVAMVWLISVVRSGSMREPRAAHLFALLFVLWNACSMLWTLDGPATQERLITYVQLLGLMLVVWDTVTTTKAVRQALLAYLLGCCVTVASLLYGYTTLGEASEIHGRVTVFGFDPNDVGMILALAVPVAAYFVDSPGRGRWRTARAIAASAYIPLAGWAILLTGSRSALAGMLPGLVYLGYLLARRHPAVAVGSLGALAVSGVLAIPLLPPQVAARLSGTASAVEGGDLNHREDVWAEALRLFHDQPFTGIGGGAFRAAAVGVNKVGHNFVLALLAEVGVVGLALFLSVLVAALLSLRNIEPLLRWMWTAVFVTWTFGALLQNLEYRKHSWFLFALVVANGFLAGRADREGVEDDDCSPRPERVT